MIGRNRYFDQWQALPRKAKTARQFWPFLAKIAIGSNVYRQRSIGLKNMQPIISAHIDIFRSEQVHSCSLQPELRSAKTENNS